MIIDQQNSFAGEGLVEFPNFVFANLPVQPDDVKEHPQVIGQPSNASAIQGSVGTTQPGPSIIFPVS